MGKSTRRNVSLVFCALGIMASAYAYHVETSKESDSSYTAFCDFNDHMSCSKVFTSKWGRGMGLVEDYLGKDHFLNQPNSVPGIIFYLSVIALELIPGVMAAKLQVMFSVLSLASCVWLGYILFFVLHDVCVVCCSMYVINTVLFIGSMMRYNAAASTKSKQS